MRPTQPLTVADELRIQELPDDLRTLYDRICADAADAADAAYARGYARGREDEEDGSEYDDHEH